jgi:hypothetical protein
MLFVSEPQAPVIAAAVQHSTTNKRNRLVNRVMIGFHLVNTAADACAIRR